MIEESEDLGQALKRAAALVADLPEDLRSVAFQEAFRVLREPEPVLNPAARGDNPSVPARNPAQMPDADLVADEGGRIHKIAYAVHRINGEGGASTTGAIKLFLAQQLATKIGGNGVPNVLKANTPRFFQRQKGGREFSYVLTDKGVAMLEEFRRAKSHE